MDQTFIQFDVGEHSLRGLRNVRTITTIKPTGQNFQWAPPHWRAVAAMDLDERGVYLTQPCTPDEVVSIFSGVEPNMRASLLRTTRAMGLVE